MKGVVILSQRIAKICVFVLLWCQWGLAAEILWATVRLNQQSNHLGNRTSHLRGVLTVYFDLETRNFRSLFREDGSLLPQDRGDYSVVLSFLEGYRRKYLENNHLFGVVSLPIEELVIHRTEFQTQSMGRHGESRIRFEWNIDHTALQLGSLSVDGRTIPAQTLTARNYGDTLSLTDPSSPFLMPFTNDFSLAHFNGEGFGLDFRTVLPLIHRMGRDISLSALSAASAIIGSAFLLSDVLRLPHGMAIDTVGPTVGLFALSRILWHVDYVLRSNQQRTALAISGNNLEPFLLPQAPFLDRLFAFFHSYSGHWLNGGAQQRNLIPVYALNERMSEQFFLPELRPTDELLRDPQRLLEAIHHPEEHFLFLQVQPGFGRRNFSATERARSFLPIQASPSDLEDFLFEAFLDSDFRRGLVLTFLERFPDRVSHRFLWRLFPEKDSRYEAAKYESVRMAAIRYALFTNSARFHNEREGFIAAAALDPSPAVRLLGTIALLRSPGGDPAFREDVAMHALNTEDRHLRRILLEYFESNPRYASAPAIDQMTRTGSLLQRLHAHQVRYHLGLGRPNVFLRCAIFLRSMVQ